MSHLIIKISQQPSIIVFILQKEENILPFSGSLV